MDHWTPLGDSAGASIRFFVRVFVLIPLGFHKEYFSGIIGEVLGDLAVTLVLKLEGFTASGVIV